MTEITNITVPALANVPNVEIAQTGQWDASTGRVTLTDDDFANAVAALDCPAVHRPIIKIGHTDTRFAGDKVGQDGEPAIGWVANMATVDNGHTITGDFLGMPGWLGPIVNSAYPQRSMEATWDFMCQLGHVHPFVITAVALLGVTPPAIGTLESLQDVASLYGVSMAASDTTDHGGHSVSVVASQGVPTMPNPKPREVAAGITTEDIRRTYYETAEYTKWIKELELDPLQLITIDEATGEYARIPVTISGGEFTFGDAVPVAVEYVDKPAQVAASARIVYASKGESRNDTEPDTQPEPPQPLTAAEGIKRVAAATVATEETQDSREDSGMDPTKIREALGLSADATDDEVLAAVQGKAGTPAVAATAGPGVVVMDQSVVAEMKRQAELGARAYEVMRKNERDSIIASAIQEGKFSPARKEAWEKLWDADPEGTRTQIEGLSKSLIPLAASGYAGDDSYQNDEAYFSLYPETRPERNGL